MRDRFFIYFVKSFGIAILYAFQKRYAWKIMNWVDDEILRSKYERGRDFSSRPYPKPRRKNLYLRDSSDWE